MSEKQNTVEPWPKCLTLYNTHIRNTWPDEAKALTLKLINEYPSSEWTRVYSDGSATDATKNGGGGIVAQFLNSSTQERSIPTGFLYSNYKAEQEAIIEAYKMVCESNSVLAPKVVLLTDTRSEKTAELPQNTLRCLKGAPDHAETELFLWVIANFRGMIKRTACQKLEP